MSWFRRRQRSAEVDVVDHRPAEPDPADITPGECTLCLRTYDPQDLSELRDKAYRKLYGYYCDSCEKLHGELQPRFRYVDKPGNRPWLVSDPGTERRVKASPSPLDAVVAVIDELAPGISEVAPPAARITALRRGVYGAQRTIACQSREEAARSVSGLIAHVLAVEYQNIKKYKLGHSALTVALFGGGAGVLLQEVTTTYGDWLKQTCYLMDTDHRVHPYMYWHR
jgi:hypothetical protein